MKRIVIALCTAAVLCTFSACRSVDEQSRLEEESRSQSADAESSADYQQPPDPTTPDGALTLLLDSAVEWDVEQMEQGLPDNVSLDEYIHPALQDITARMLHRMEYTVEEYTLEDEQATVELTITSVDVQRAFNEMVGTAVAYMTKQQLENKPVDDFGELSKTIADAVDVDKLPTVTYTTTAYLQQQENGDRKSVV